MKQSEVYKNPEIANNYNDFLEKRKDLCLFDEKYLNENIGDGLKILDLGCGTGRHLLGLEKKASSMTGIDISPRMIEIVNSKLKEKNITKIKTLVGDILDIDSILGNEKFDIVIMMYHTLGSIVPRKNRLVLLKKINKLLKKEGHFIFHVHNKNHIHNLRFLFNNYFKNKLERGDRDIKEGVLGGSVIHFFSRREIKKDLALSNFKVVDFVNLNFPKESKKIKGSKKYFYTGGFIIKARKMN